MLEQLLLAFVTGLTTGGLSCLAVQGGLLASSLAGQIESSLVKPSKAAPRKKGTPPAQSRAAPTQDGYHQLAGTTIGFFLLAKLAAYTLLGGLLGWAGSYLTLSPVSRAVLLIGIGIFMLGNGLRMLNVHPIFRYFALQPPRSITRYIRRTAKGAGDSSQPTWLTPVFLGLLTVLIPCGITQVMMAAALGTGSAITGAALMFAFTLGTSPVFFVIAYFATRLGGKLEKHLMRFVAVVLLVLGVLSVENGLNLMGSPVSGAALMGSLAARNLPPPETISQEQAADFDGSGAKPILMTVANNGYFPGIVRAEANIEHQLILQTDNTRSCSRDFVIPALKFYELLPITGQVTVDIPPQEPGTVLRLTCSMGMYTSQIIFD